MRAANCQLDPISPSLLIGKIASVSHMRVRWLTSSRSLYDGLHAIIIREVLLPARSKRPQLAGVPLAHPPAAVPPRGCNNFASPLPLVREISGWMCVLSVCGVSTRKVGNSFDGTRGWILSCKTLAGCIFVFVRYFLARIQSFFQFCISICSVFNYDK